MVGADVETEALEEDVAPPELGSSLARTQEHPPRQGERA